VNAIHPTLSLGEPTNNERRTTNKGQRKASVNAIHPPSPLESRRTTNDEQGPTARLRDPSEIPSPDEPGDLLGMARVWISG
jgi:hypothetical protein